MRLGLLVLGGLLAALPLAAEEPWILQTGPQAVESIPLDPVQPVSGWRGLYADGASRIWVYTTRSAWFFPQAVPEARVIAGTPWTVVAFFPGSWKTSQRATWLSRWVTEFQSLSTLPSPGGQIVFPAVLTKG